MDGKELFISKANARYNGKFDYSKFEYVDAKTKSTIICPAHGEFIQSPKVHLSAIYGCMLCFREEEKNKFFVDARAKYGDKFDYSKFEYVNAKTKSIIVCPTHGEFIQNPDKHLQSVYGCSKCSYVLKKRKLTQNNGDKRQPVDVFVLKFKHKYGDTFTLNVDNYVGMTIGSVTISCDVHGDVTGIPRNFLISEFGCPKCGHVNARKNSTATYSEAKQQLIEKHNGRYEYPDDNALTYVNKKSKIRIICHKHGEFIKKAQKHLSGQGCIQCKQEELVAAGKLPGGYNDSYFEQDESRKTEVGFLYYVKLGRVYKIGITTNLDNRLRALKSKSRKPVDIIFTKAYNMLDAYTIEQTIMKVNAEVRTFRKWSTELFSQDISDKIRHYFEENI